MDLSAALRREVERVFTLSWREDEDEQTVSLTSKK